MRLSTISRWAVATIAATGLAACAGRGIVPSSPTAMAPTTAMRPTAIMNEAQPDGALLPLNLKTCATSPPQYQWIFKGACDEFTLKSSGGKFSLGEYKDFTVTGSIGKNTAKTAAKVVLADAIDKKGDVEKYKGKNFPPYKGNGTTILYASAMNQSSETIKPIV
ncbi:MAG: hypothetical protein JO302_01750, partial [Candidatus Eremiobacteraeota bacterium]|nr:hypothetical protein [Candidatus Eremiobacteraeota bacterium]